MADMTKLTDLLAEITTSSTFTAEALAKFQGALDKATVLEKSLADAISTRDAYKRQVDDKDHQLLVWSAQAEKLQKRETTVAAREAAITALEMKVAVAEAKESVRKEVFETIFRNTIVRRSTLDSVSGSGTDLNGVYRNTNTSHSTTETTQAE